MAKTADISTQTLNKITLMTKLLYMQTRGKVEDLKKEVLKTPQQIKAYAALDGNHNMKEIASLAGYADTKTLEAMLPDWESKGLILSVGGGPYKRYVSIENLEV